MPFFKTTQYVAFCEMAVVPAKTNSTADAVVGVAVTVEVVSIDVLLGIVAASASRVAERSVLAKVPFTALT